MQTVEECYLRRRTNRQFMTVGMFQFVIGIGCAVLGGIMIAINSNETLPISSSSVICGILFLVTGCLAFATGFPFNRCVLIVGIILTSFSVIFSTVLIGLSSTQLALDRKRYRYGGEDSLEAWRTRILCLLGSIEFIVTLVHLVFCCQGIKYAKLRNPTSHPSEQPIEYGLQAVFPLPPPSYDQLAAPYKVLNNEVE